jgi:glycosyltransferase involved in cell wall biosynthesis
MPLSYMRILLATAQVPFLRGGAEAHAESLSAALSAGGHQVELVRIPFKWDPPEKILDHALACRLLDLSECSGLSVDRLIALKFPAYLLPHPNKVVWILHQHRSAYELWDAPFGSDLICEPEGAAVREAIRQMDRVCLREARAIFANSSRVAQRLWEYCRLSARPLYHPPPDSENFYMREAEDFFYFPSRLTPIKRQKLVLEALPLCRQPVRVFFSGSPDHPDFAQELAREALSLEQKDRVRWLGSVSEETKRELYARCLGVLFPPFDEDYGYVPLEAMLSAKPVITCKDSGGPLEFVRHEQTGLVVDPTPEALAAAMDLLWKERGFAQKLGEEGRRYYESLGISWGKVLEALLA